VAAIEEDFAIPINHYVELNFDTFANVVNALGGVRMYFPVPIYDAYSGLNIERRDAICSTACEPCRSCGASPADSTHAIQPLSAHLAQEALSDLARIRRTHEFLRVLAAQVAARGLDNPSSTSAWRRRCCPTSPSTAASANTRW